MHCASAPTCTAHINRRRMRLDIVADIVVDIPVARVENVPPLRHHTCWGHREHAMLKPSFLSALLPLLLQQNNDQFTQLQRNASPLRSGRAGAFSAQSASSQRQQHSTPNQSGCAFTAASKACCSDEFALSFIHVRPSRLFSKKFFLCCKRL